MKNKNILLVLLAYILLFVSAVFAGVNDETAMDLYGRISKITLDEQGNIKEVHLENTVEEGEPYDKVVVIITDETDIINGHISELKEGEIVGIVFKEGPIMMLYPPRIEAELIMFGGGEDAARIMVPVDLERERNDQKSVDEGHSPWKLDPVFVTQVFVSLEISPEGISGEYPVRSEELVLEDITEEKAVVSVRTEDSPISRVYLERLIKRGPGGIWTVTGYDLKEDEIIEAFLSLIDEKRTPAELIDFIDKNISYLSKESAADMIAKLE
ncbi:MAG: hypothetical protein GX175_10605 [Halanaerobiaceae bacterium]|nr:hypothetical protein [Halanaerobiaceae bacterium]